MALNERRGGSTPALRDGPAIPYGVGEARGAVRVPRSKGAPSASRRGSTCVLTPPTSVESVRGVLERHGIPYTLNPHDCEIPAVWERVLVHGHHGLEQHQMRWALSQATSGAEVANLQQALERDFNVLVPEFSSCDRPPVEDVRASRVKRMIDLALASILLVLLALPVLLAALAVKLDSPGPVLFRQRRVGLHGRQFEIVKLRSMYHGAEPDGPVWAQPGDPRVTRVGRYLRGSRLDEIPQLWNVLRGDMSLVGPRPERPEFVEQLSHVIPDYHVRHLMPPGITGLAQVRYGYARDSNDALAKHGYDLYYHRNHRLAYDAQTDPVRDHRGGGTPG